MAQEIEIEYKNILTKKEFELLLTTLPFSIEGKTQTNYYFETKEFSLKSHGAALRIREKQGNYQLTLKEPNETGLLETHDTLSEVEVDQWLSGKPMAKQHTQHQLDKWNISVSELSYYGALTTIRREIRYKNVLLVLDYSTYNGQVDYELELEAPTEEVGESVFQSLLKEFAIPERKTPNKIQRFFQSLSKD
ncbi:CYTH domain-containing protein [Oceanobacillus manasiensis]|uniref:CYTH domain-containing protein n=1 Tax=Oceanobacillus manasiensis TaxID=586413 RepID=UPI0005A77571|nr:CYTH domain-containing protein [Oceanobacillus manasiensis]